VAAITRDVKYRVSCEMMTATLTCDIDRLRNGKLRCHHVIVRSLLHLVKRRRKALHLYVCTCFHPSKFIYVQGKGFSRYSPKETLTFLILIPTISIRKIRTSHLYTKRNCSSQQVFHFFLIFDCTRRPR
jgi:hypothetical protein